MDQNRNIIQLHPFLAAAKSGDMNSLKRLLPIMVNSPSLLNVTTPQGDTALILAVRGGHLDVVNLLIDNKVDVNIQTDFGLGYTALMYAVEANYPLIVEALLLANANINLTDFNGKSALKIDKNRMIKRLLEGLKQEQRESCSAVLWAFYYATGALSTRFLPMHDKTKPENQQPLLYKPTPNIDFK